MLVAVGKHIVEIGDTIQKSREAIRVLGESFRDQIKDTRHLNIEVDDIDNSLLGLLLKVVVHSNFYSKLETLEQKKSTLFNIARIITCLSKAFKEEYFDSNQRSIFRDLEFLHKILMPEGQIQDHVNHFISDRMGLNIFDEVIKFCDEIVFFELNSALSHDERQIERTSFKDSYKLPNLYTIVNYYREIESLEKAISLLNNKYLQILNLSTLEGKCSLFRILEKLGESVSQKNLSFSSKLLEINIDWDLLVAVRNRLAHQEWYLSEERGRVLDRLFDFDLTGILKYDLPFMRSVLETILSNLKAIALSITIHPRIFDRQILDYYKPLEEPEFFLTEDGKAKIIGIIEWFFTNAYISFNDKQNLIYQIDCGSNKEFFNQLKSLLNKDFFEKEYEEKLYSEELKLIRDIKQKHAMIYGDLHKDINLNKAKQQAQKYLKKYCEIKGEDASKYNVYGCKSAEGILLITPKIDLTKELQEVVLLYNKIKTVKKNSNLIRELYDILKQKRHINDDEDTKLGQLTDQSKKGEIDKKVASQKIDELKLAVIERWIITLGLTSISKDEVGLIQDYKDLIQYLRPAIPKTIKDRINDLTTFLQSKGFLNDSQVEEITALQPHEQLENLRLFIGEDKFSDKYEKALTSSELLLVQEMKSKLGQVDKLIDEEYREFTKYLKSADSDIEKAKLENMIHFRELRDILPDEQKSILDIDKAVGGIRDIVLLINEVLEREEFSPFRMRDKSFSEEFQYLILGSSANCLEWAVELARLGYFQNEEYRNSLALIQRVLTPDGIWIPNNHPIEIDIDDVIGGRGIAVSRSKEEMISYLQREREFIISETVNYANFIRLALFLQENQTILHTLEYLVSSIFPYLGAICKYLPSQSVIPVPLELELKAQRNEAKHGSVFVDILVSQRHSVEMLIRYMSIFLKDVYPNLPMIKLSFLAYKASWSWSNDEDKDLREAKKKSLEEYYKSQKSTEYEEKVQWYGFELNKVAGDGNCFFHAVLDQLRNRNIIGLDFDPNTIDHTYLRARAVNWIIQKLMNDPKYLTRLGINNIDEYIEKMMQDKTWAEDIIIEALAADLGVELILVNNHHALPTSVNRGAAHGILYLAYHEGTHFDSLRSEPNDNFAMSYTLGTTIFRLPKSEEEKIESQNSDLYKFIIDKFFGAKKIDEIEKSVLNETPECFFKISSTFLSFHPEYNLDLTVSFLNNGLKLVSCQKYAKSLLYLEESLRLQESSGIDDYELKSKTFYNLGRSYTEIQEYDKGLEFFDKLLEIVSIKEPNSQAYAQCLYDVGIVNNLKGNFAEAISNISSSIIKLKELGEIEYQAKIASILFYLGEIHEKLGNFAEAKVSYQECYNNRISFLSKDHADTKRVESKLYEIDYFLGTPIHPSVYYVKDIIYDNPLINDETLMSQAKLFGGNELVRLLLDLGQNSEYCYQIIEAIREQGYDTVFKTLLGIQDADYSVIASHDYTPEKGIVLTDSKSTQQLKNDITLSLKSYDVSYTDKTKNDQALLIADSSQTSSGNALVSISGAGVMKVIEVKESITYLFTEIIPIFDKPPSQEEDSFLSKEGVWISIHLAGGIAFSWGLPGAENIGMASRVLAPISATSSYALRHYYHEEFKQQCPGYTLALDTVFTVLTSLPVAYMTGNYGILVQSAGHGAAINLLSQFSSNEVSWNGWFAGNLAALAIACKKAADIMPAEHNFGGAIITINKIASMIAGVTLAYKLVSQVAEHVIDTIGSVVFVNEDEL